MQIKSSNKKSNWSNIVLIFGLLVLVILLSSLWRKYFKDNIETFNTPSPTTQEFLEKRVSILEVLDFFSSDYQIFLAVADDAGYKLPQDIREALKDKGGIEIANLQFRESYVGLFENGKFVEEKRNSEESVSIESAQKKVESAGNKSGGFANFYLDKKKFESLGRGLNLFILHKDESEFYKYNFDFFASENPLAINEFSNKLNKNLPIFELIIPPKAFKKIEKKREEALEKKVLLTSSEDFVDARLIFNNEPYDVEIRLKGDWTDHLVGEKWSYRVKLKEGTLMGMRKFSIHHPSTRNYVGEWLFHKGLAENDILNLQYHFVNLSLTVPGDVKRNKRQLGIFALEESFEKYLVERMRRREGVIIKIDEGPVWEKWSGILSDNLEMQDFNAVKWADLENLNIIPFNQGKIMKEPHLKKQFEVARELLRSFIAGERTVSEVFDIEKLAFYNAFTNLMGARHSLFSINWRLYFNPISSRLEPVGFDGNAGGKQDFLVTWNWAYQDEKFMTAYGKALERIIQDDFLDGLISFPDLENQVKILESAFSEFTWEEENLIHNRANIKYRLFPAKCLHVFLEEKEAESITLSIENYGEFPIEILDLKYETSRRLALPSEKIILFPKEKKLIKFDLDKNFQQLFVSKKKKIAKFSIEKDLEKIQVSWQTLGTSILKHEPILPWKGKETKDLLAVDLNNPPTEVTPQEYLIIDYDKKIVSLKPGLWKIDESIVIPAAYEFHISEGCKLDMLNANAKIISFGKLSWQGTKANPIEIFSTSQKGAGVFVLNTKDTSILNQVIFSDLNPPIENNWSLSGAINFYHSPVKISNTVFEKNHSEDGLNIINSYFEMDNVHFSNTQSDAFDGDFAEGWIKNSTFVNLGNDGIDVSGSDILVENTVISKAGDKGLSGGEKSKIIAKNLLISESEIAVASKDLTTIELEKLVIKNNKLGFTAFQKKSEYGVSHIIANEVESTENDLEFLIEHESSLILNGKKVETESNVIERMYGEEFGIKSQ